MIGSYSIKEVSNADQTIHYLVIHPVGSTTCEMVIYLSIRLLIFTLCCIFFTFFIHVEVVALISQSECRVLISHGTTKGSVFKVWFGFRVSVFGYKNLVLTARYFLGVSSLVT